MRRHAVLLGVFSLVITGLICLGYAGNTAFAATGSASQAGKPQSPELGVWSVTAQQAVQVASPDSVDESGILPVRIAAPGYTRVRVRWGEKTWTVRLHDGHAGTLLPAPATRPKTGRQTLVVEAGKTSVRRSVAVRAVRWPVQKLKVSPEYVTPPKSVLQRIAAERKRTQKALSGAQDARLWQGDFQNPLEKMTTTNAFGGKRLFNGQLRSRHWGLDLRGAAGTPVRAAAAGRVLMAEEQYYSGKMIYMDHGDGLLTFYCHLSHIDVHPGEFVQQGQQIGLVGATGRVTGPHLHFGVRVRGQMVNPWALLGLSEALLTGREVQ